MNESVPERECVCAVVKRERDSVVLLCGSGGHVGKWILLKDVLYYFVNTFSEIRLEKCGCAYGEWIDVRVVEMCA